MMIKGVKYLDQFISNPLALSKYLLDNVAWDLRMKSRKTASFGVSYNYSQISYPENKMIPSLSEICQTISDSIGFKPNNCLINLYPDGKSKMGFHSDQIDILKDNTGVAILSLGAERNLRFRNIKDNEIKIDYLLASGSLLYMDQQVQKDWQHAIPKDNSVIPRMSLTFRNIK